MTSFSGILNLQWPSHCGPASLASCLSVLGLSASQRRVAHATGKSVASILHDGLDEHDIARAARRLGVRTQFVGGKGKTDASYFESVLRSHMHNQHSPALLLVQDAAHWIAVLSHDATGDRYVIMDPNDDERSFSFWSPATLRKLGWNNHETEGGFFAILVNRADNRPPLWRLTRAFLRLCERGSAESALEMVATIREVGKRSGGHSAHKVAMADLIKKHEDILVKNCAHWSNGEHSTVRELREVCRDYQTVAEAASVQLPEDADLLSFIAQMSSLLATFAEYGEL
jgi:hypothetical protein